jgi:hypothetical protein
VTDPNILAAKYGVITVIAEGRAYCQYDTNQKTWFKGPKAGGVNS